MTANTANVIGLGLIGGSIATGLTKRGWYVSGTDREPATERTALATGVVSEIAVNPDASVTLVATPVGETLNMIEFALNETSGAVTDVGSVKADVCNAVNSSRFIGGHPMAGSELSGLEGADPNMFEGAVWVLTPSPSADDHAVAATSRVVQALGAEPVALSPHRHDDIVAVVSHVPHLTAATLMKLAAERAEHDAPLLRLAAGGFRDMTRIAAGHPRIWLDICEQNREAIVAALDALVTGLSDLRSTVERGDRQELATVLAQAREARTNLPGSVAHPENIAEVRIPIPDRTGAAAEVFTLAADLSVNIANFEVVHLAEGNRGVAVVLVDADSTELFRGGLIARGFRPSIRRLTA